MKCFVSLLALVALLPQVLSNVLHSRQSQTDQSDKYIFPDGSPGFYNGKSNASVTLDQHSLLLDGKRIMFFSGEFHPFRLPAPELWRDVLEKYTVFSVLLQKAPDSIHFAPDDQAAGFTGVSVYWHWGLTAPNAREVRFTEHNDLAKFYQAAKEVGILVIVRPGPYVNAETAGGGIPGWTTNIPGLARTNASDYKDAWRPYILGFARETAPFQYPEGPVVAVQGENEFATRSQSRIPGLDEHMQDIIDTMREGGLTRIPTIHNDKNPSGQYAQKGLGKVDLYGWDGYPLGFDCDTPSHWTELSTQADTNHQRWNPAEPLALFEWQGGAFSYWSGPSYDMCYQLINERFANVYYKNNYAAGTSIQNLYMTYGGTNWGNMHTHTIYSSYDYGAAIREDRTLSPKLGEIKLQSYFLHASPDYLLVGRIGNGTVGQGTAYSTSRDIYTTHLRSRPSDTNFYVVRQTTNQKTTETRFKLHVNTTSGTIEIPRNGAMTLDGRESKIIVTNYPFGKSKLQYSTAEVMTWTTFDGVDTILLYGNRAKYLEVAVENPSKAPVTTVGSNTVKPTASATVVTLAGTPSSITQVTFGNTRVIVTDKQTATNFWAPRLSGAEGYHHYHQTPDVPAIFVDGPYLVRSATARGSIIDLIGDINAPTGFSVYAPTQFTRVTWNGADVAVQKNKFGALQGTIDFPDELVNDVIVPDLKTLEWKCADSLPELQPGFDDSKWVLANKTSTRRPQQPTAGKFVLYSSEYGFHAGQWVWRGHFNGVATGVQLSIQGGFSFGYSVFLNSHFLGSGEGSSHSQDGVDILSPTFNFTSNQLNDSDNVLTVIHDSTGMNQDYNINDEHKTPRGIRGYRLLSSDRKDFTEWRVAGNFRGENAPDKVRGPYNEGGWWFERVGAHLPGYDDSAWTDGCTPYQGVTHPGVTVYRTKFDLDLPRDTDIPLAFDFALDSEAPHRVLLYVNGWQFGRFLSSLGPQTSYPIPEGILNHHGENEILISLWALNPGGAKLPKLSLNKRAVLSSSKRAEVDAVEAPGWAELRMNELE